MIFSMYKTAIRTPQAGRCHSIAVRKATWYENIGVGHQHSYWLAYDTDIGEVLEAFMAREWLTDPAGQLPHNPLNTQRKPRLLDGTSVLRFLCKV